MGLFNGMFGGGDEAQGGGGGHPLLGAILKGLGGSGGLFGGLTGGALGPNLLGSLGNYFSNKNKDEEDDNPELKNNGTIQK